MNKIGRKIVAIRQLNGDPVVEVFIKREMRWFRTVSRTWFRFKEDWHIEVEHENGTKRRVTIQAGFESNGASIPYLLRGGLICWLLGIPNAQEIIIAAFLHDWIYHRAQYSRELCDWIFRYAIVYLCEKPRRKAQRAWLGVRLGGASCYNQRKQTAKGGKQ